MTTIQIINELNKKDSSIWDAIKKILKLESPEPYTLEDMETPYTGPHRVSTVIYDPHK